MTLTLATVKRSGLPATWRGVVGYHETRADYLPDNLPEECVRLYSVHPNGSYFGGIMFGPGSAEIAKGWTHGEDCVCPLSPRCRS